ncbi:MAG: VWA domain-containing protein [Dehalococcoidales bacterium]|nr:VWA domain-containing protein [Dehalococcoidales bacterium]
MSFLWIKLLWLLLLIPVLVLAYVLAQRRRRKYAVRYSSLALVRDAAGRGPGMRRHIPAIIFLTGLAVMIFALARPAATVMLPSQQATVILTFDVSGSMRADDIKPNRIEAAKSAALTFIGKQPQNIRIGIVSFSDGASIVQAPTKDREAIIAAVNRLAPQRRTAIGSGILTSLDAIFEQPDVANPVTRGRDPLGQPTPTPDFKQVPPGTYAPAVIVLLSDGVSNTGPLPLEVVEQASNRGVRIYTVGLGSTEGAVLRADGFSMRVRLDEDTLKRIAQNTDGTYYKASNETDLHDIYEALSTNIVLTPEKTELTAGFTGLAIVLLLAAGTLSLLWFSRLP